MEAIKIERSILNSLENSVGLSGVREDDEVNLDLFQEKAKNFRLKRTKYKIITGSKFDFDFSKAEICLPIFDQTVNEFELLLIKHYCANDFNAKSRYLLRSVGPTPFRLNGGSTFEAFLERGDIVEIGFNRIQFLRPKRHLKLADDSTYLPDEVIKSNLSVMIEGETGTGKTTLAKQIHESSNRGGRFIHLNLSSFAPNLIESELFGHVKGAFTGAVNEKKGAILEAHKGTLFLDEIDSLSIELQTKLLLFLDSHEVRAVGGGTSLHSDVRLIFASGAKLTQLLKEARMRRDFYFRLTTGVVLLLPGIRNNPEKIKSICLDFENKNFVIFSEELLKFYQECPWPGNIRQLVSHLMKKKVLANGKKIIIDKIDFDLLEDNLSVSGFDSTMFKPLESIKMDYCLNVFIKMDKNITKASKVLEISPNTLKALLANRNKLRSHEIVDINF